MNSQGCCARSGGYQGWQHPHATQFSSCNGLRKSRFAAKACRSCKGLWESSSKGLQKSQGLWKLQRFACLLQRFAEVGRFGVEVEKVCCKGLQSHGLWKLQRFAAKVCFMLQKSLRKLQGFCSFLQVEEGSCKACSFARVVEVARVALFARLVESRRNSYM